MCLVDDQRYDARGARGVVPRAGHGHEGRQREAPDAIPRRRRQSENDQGMCSRDAWLNTQVKRDCNIIVALRPGLLHKNGQCF